MAFELQSNLSEIALALPVVTGPAQEQFGTYCNHKIIKQQIVDFTLLFFMD